MTVELLLSDGKQERRKIFRKVYKGKSYAQIVENFYSFKNDMQWGKLFQLKGKERILLHSFETINYKGDN